LLHWQYVDRVCALVSTDNMPIHRESFGVLTATLVPPVMVVVVNLCELLLAAEQGITSFSVSFSQTGSITQDILLSKVLRKTSEFYLNKFGFDNVSVYLVYHQWMGSFPYDYDMANSLISNSAQIGSMVGADKIITKTKEEARGIPSVQNNTDAVRLVRYVLDRNKFNYEHLDIDIENSSLNKQVSSVMRAIFKLPVKEFWNSVNFAIKNGYIDIPFAPHESNKNQLITQRGKDNGIYILDPGKVPIPNEYLIDDIRAVANNDHLKSKDSLFKIMMQDINLMVE